MQEYLIVFSQSLLEFRLPELESIKSLLGVEIELPDVNDINLKTPCLVVKLLDDDAALKLCSRCMLIKFIVKLYAYANDYEQLHSINKTKDNEWNKYQYDTFSMEIMATYISIPLKRRIELIEQFSYMDLKGGVRFRNPKNVFIVFEEHLQVNPDENFHNNIKRYFNKVYFGLKVSDGQRGLISKYDVKNRRYFGNTSMESEVTVLMANQVLASPGKLVYDPFVGTGSMLYLCAHFGAYVMGSDMDSKQMKGQEGKQMKGHPLSRDGGIKAAAFDYGVQSKFLDMFTADVTKIGWRLGGFLDGIVTDPPYGVRAGAKKIGVKEGAKIRPIHNQMYNPQVEEYDLSNLAADLIVMSAYLLKKGGRLVYFLPTVNEEYKETDIPVCDGMKIIANSIQDFGKWSRRLITMEKTDDVPIDEPLHKIMSRLDISKSQQNVSHNKFREKV